MALDLSCIDNVEFYSGHYIEALLEGDLKQTFDSWKRREDDTGKKPPWHQLARLAERYFQARESAADLVEPLDRWQPARTFHANLIAALGYDYAPTAVPIDDGTADGAVLPVLTALERDGAPWLWIVDTPFPRPTHDDEDPDPLAEPPFAEQLPTGTDAPLAGAGESSWRDLIDDVAFTQDHAPRWILILTGAELLLAERHKWRQGKTLRVDLADLFRRRETDALRAVCGLFHKDVLAPDAGLCVHDTLDENSHKHAFAVSGDLKHGVRRAIELLGNEAVRYLREVRRQRVFADAEGQAGIDPDALTRDCLTWVYRLLFMFYVEARSEDLGVVPMSSDTYRKGYSLEALRELELVPLTTEHARDGFYLHASLERLFDVVQDGFPTAEQRPNDFYPGLIATRRASSTHGFEVTAVRSPLFDDDRLAYLGKVRFRNVVLQEVLQLLSLSAVKKRKQRGRISYAQLGINQLGAVYESLLSYSGFFSETDLAEVASTSDVAHLDKARESGTSAGSREDVRVFFVPKDKLADYHDGEIVKGADGRAAIHPRGTYLYALAGRNREKSASYYTPEVLTRCVVKYALKELLWEQDDDGRDVKRKLTADEILHLTICEPAMGSGAFLLEAVDQLADQYLTAKQDELGERIDPANYQRQKRRVKARLATSNCHGVDLNPTAVELAKVSLWLGTMHEGGKCPWFGLRLATGNSLIGARRQVYRVGDLTRKGSETSPNWLGIVPDDVPMFVEGADVFADDWKLPARPKGNVYHFLVPAEGMASFGKDKVAKQLAPKACAAMEAWRKEFVEPFSKQDVQRLEALSDAVDRLWAQVVRERAVAARETTDRIPVWPEVEGASGDDLYIRDREDVQAALEASSSAYQRLKLVMDLWCALWFWPLAEAAHLPDRKTWLRILELSLIGDAKFEGRQLDLFEKLTRATSEPGGPATLEVAESIVETARAARLRTLRERFDGLRSQNDEGCGFADVSALAEADPAVRITRAVAEQTRFHHWQLRFAEVFAQGGGFDFMLGNPPWVKIDFDIVAAASDLNPRGLVQRLGTTALAVSAAEQCEVDAALRSVVLEELERARGLIASLSAKANHPLLKGQHPNLYKCFLMRVFDWMSRDAVAAMIHPTGILDDSKAAESRKHLLPRARFLFQFENQLSLFSILHTRKFAVAIYASQPRDPIEFLSVSTLFHPNTIDACLVHDGRGAIPMRRTSAGWGVSGHRDRVVGITHKTLRSYGGTFEVESEDPSSSPVPRLYSKREALALETLAAYPKRLRSISPDFTPSEMWNESGAQKSGIIARNDHQPCEMGDYIMSGPNIALACFVGQSANEGCRSPLDYSEVDLTIASSAFLPRCVYRRACSVESFQEAQPRRQGVHLDRFWKLAARKMVDSTTERSLIAAVVPPGVTHIDGVFSLSSDIHNIFSALWPSVSIVWDFLVRVSGKTNLRQDLFWSMPYFSPGHPLSQLGRIRFIQLSAVHDSFAETLWAKGATSDHACPALADPRIPLRVEPDTVHRNRRLRSPLARRAAMVEIDVLAALLAGWNNETLTGVLRSSFDRLLAVESTQLYDQHGRVVPTSSTVSGNHAVNLVALAASLREQADFDTHRAWHPDTNDARTLLAKKIKLSKRDADVLRVTERCTMADLLVPTEVHYWDTDDPEGRAETLLGLRYTDPGLYPERERTYPTPWTRCDREADYELAWEHFEMHSEHQDPLDTNR